MPMELRLELVAAIGSDLLDAKWKFGDDVINKINRRSAIDARTTRHSGYDVSQRVRKRIEEIFGWGKDVGPIRKTKFRGKDRVGFQLLLTLAGYNLIRMRNILAEVPT